MAALWTIKIIVDINAKMEEREIGNRFPREIWIEQSPIAIFCSGRMSDRRSKRHIAPNGIMKNASIDQIDIVSVKNFFE